MIADYEQLDKELSEILNLSQGCVFVLSANKDGKLLEFVYPVRLKGTLVPVDGRSVVGRAASYKRFYLSNNIQAERDFIFLGSLMSRKGDPIQKVITYPVIFADKVVQVIQITRRGTNLSEAGKDFTKEDVEKVKAYVEELFTLRIVESA